MSAQRLKGRRILLVEDEFFQAMEAKRLFEQEGAQVVGPTGFAEDIPGLLQSERPIDAAVLDINLGRGTNFSVARALRREGVPFLFLTGYNLESIPDELAGAPCLSKPADERQVIAMVEGLVAG